MQYNCPFAVRRRPYPILLCQYQMDAQPEKDYNILENGYSAACAYQHECRRTHQAENTERAKNCYEFHRKKIN